MQSTCLECVEVVAPHQRVLLLQRHAQLLVLAHQGVQLLQVSFQGLGFLHQIPIVATLGFNQAWWGWSRSTAQQRLERPGQFYLKGTIHSELKFHECDVFKYAEPLRS